MYESFFEFRRRPFAAAPQADLFYPGRTIESARQSIERCLIRVEGAALLVGPAGTGKTLLGTKLADRFRADTAVVNLMSGQLATRRALLQAVLYELGLPYRGLEEGELRIALVDRLTGKTDERGMLLVVDDAHLLPLRLLEEVRLLADLNRRGEPRVRLLLVGGSSLEERLASPRLDALQQRITARSYLEAFDHSDTVNYIRHQISQVGGDPTRIFTESALDVVYRATEGIARLVNQICDHALVMAFSGGVKPIDATGIEEAWADLQQLPTPWSRAKGYAAPPTLDAQHDFGSFEEEIPVPMRPRPVITPKPATNDSVEFIASAPRASEPMTFEEEAGETIGVLETQLAEWEAEFTPTAKMEPEAEVSLGASRRDPFVEDFVDEELVIDRYAATDRLRIAPKTQTYGSNESLIAALLGSRSQRRESPTLRCVDEALAMESRDAATGELEYESATATIEKPMPHASFAREIIQVEPDPVEPEDLRISPRRTTANDGDIIIIEPDPTYVPAPRVDVAAVRKQDYRQLFVRLRNGS